MKRIILTLTLVFVILTEAAYAASVSIGVIDTGVKEKEGILGSEKIRSGQNYVLGNGNTNDEVGTRNEGGKSYYRHG